MQAKFVDVDGHILEPPDLWVQYLEAEYQDRALRIRKDARGLEYLEIDGGRSWLLQGGTLGLLGAMGQDTRPYLEPGRIDYADAIPPGANDPHVRVELMNEEGIDISLIYPSLGLCWESECKDTVLAAAYCRAYNNWLFDFCKPYPDRLVPAAHIPMRDVTEAVKELERTARLGAKAAMLNSYLAGGHPYGSSYYDPLWALAQELDIPVTLHASNADEWAGAKYYPRPEDMSTWYQFVTSTVDQKLNFTTFFSEGTFERFPRLKVVVLESGCGWIGHWIERMDEVYEYFSFTTPMKLKPSEYFARQCWIAMELDESLAPVMIERLGADRFLWAFDYPHSDACGDPIETLKTTLASLPVEDQVKVFGQNAMSLYGLSGASDLQRSA